MSGVSRILHRTILWDILNVIFSLGSESGHTLSDAPDGRTTDRCGLGRVLVNLSARQAKEEGLLTSGTYGLRFTTSSASADLSRCLVNRLRLKTDSRGSMLYSLTWKQRVTPLGRLIYALRASALRTSDSGCGSWRSPQSSDGEGGVMEIRPDMAGRYKLRDEAQLASWPTCRANDAEKSGNIADDPRNGLVAAANLASWPTASSRDWKDTPGMSETGTNPDGTQRTMLDQLPRAAQLVGWGTPRVGNNGGNGNLERNGGPNGRIEDQAQLTDFGPMPNGCHAGTEKRGQLNPALSRWLMGLPVIWDLCAFNVVPLVKSRAKKLSSMRLLSQEGKTG